MVRQTADEMLHVDEGESMTSMSPHIKMAEYMTGLVAERRKTPTDDFISVLTHADVETPGGTRKLEDHELLNFITLIAGAGNETVARLMGWAGLTLAHNPDQRDILVDDRSAIPDAVEELLRYQPPSPVQARRVMRDVEVYGQTVPAGAVMLLLTGAAGRDEREYTDPDRFDVRRGGQHMTLGFGVHFCLGAALGATGRPRRHRGVPRPLPEVGGRRGPNRAGPHQHRARPREAADLGLTVRPAGTAGAVDFDPTGRIGPDDDDDRAMDHRKRRQALGSGGGGTSRPRADRLLRLVARQGRTRRRRALRHRPRRHHRIERHRRSARARAGLCRLQPHVAGSGRARPDPRGRRQRREHRRLHQRPWQSGRPRANPRRVQAWRRLHVRLGHQPRLRRADLHRHRDHLRPRRQDHDRGSGGLDGVRLSRDRAAHRVRSPHRRSRASGHDGPRFRRLR